MWQSPQRTPRGCTLPHCWFCQNCCDCQMVARHSDRLSQLAESCSWCLGLANVFPVCCHSRDAGRVLMAWGKYLPQPLREAAGLSWKLWFPSAPLVWLWKLLFWCFILSSFCGLGGAGAFSVTCLGHTTALGVLLDLGRERLCTLAMVEPTGRLCVGPAPGTTRSPGEPLHPSSLSQASGNSGGSTVTPEMLALSFLLCSPQTRFMALHWPFPLLLCLQLPCPPQTCFAPSRNFTFAVYKILSLVYSSAFNLLPQPSEENYFSHCTPVLCLPSLLLLFWGLL